MGCKSQKIVCLVVVSFFCLSPLVFASDMDDLSSKIDTDLFLEDEGSGRYTDDLEISGSGVGPHDKEDDTEVDHPVTKAPAKEPNVVKPDDIISKPDGEDIGFEETNNENNNQIFNTKEESPASFFSQPGILAAIICGAIVGLLCAILLVMFIVYRMRKKDEGSYVLDDSKRTTPSYGKSKEFFA